MALCAIILKLHETYVQFFHLQSQTLCLFLNVKPHNPITAPTLGRWLRMVLKNAGIDTDIFKAHSVRGTSTTAAVNSVPLDDVMKMADWSCVSTFQKFYYKPFFKTNYAHSVLK